VYICAEGASGMKARVAAWCHDKGIESPGRFHFLDEAVQISIKGDRTELFKALGDIRPVLIVVDTMSLCALGLSENDSGAMNQFMADVKSIQDETGAHIMLIHHNNKSGGSRGSSAIPAAAQSEFDMTRQDERVTLKCNKQKDGPEFKPMAFNARRVEYDTREHKFSLVMDYVGEEDNEVVISASVQQVCDLLQDHFDENGATATQWEGVAKDHGITKSTFFRARKTLVKSGMVQNGAGADGKVPRGAKYRLIETPTASEESEGLNGVN